MLVFSMLILLPAFYGSQQNAKAALRRRHDMTTGNSENAAFFGADQNSRGVDVSRGSLPPSNYYTPPPTDHSDFDWDSPEWRASSLVRDLIRESEMRHQHGSSEYPRVLGKGAQGNVGAADVQKGIAQHHVMDDMDLSDILTPNDVVHIQKSGGERPSDSLSSKSQVETVASQDLADFDAAHFNDEQVVSPHERSSSTSAADSTTTATTALNDSDTQNDQSTARLNPSWITRQRHTQPQNDIYYGDNVLIAPTRLLPLGEESNIDPATSETTTDSFGNPQTIASSPLSTTPTNPSTTHLQASSSVHEKKTKSATAQHLYWIQKNGTVPLSDENFKCRNTVQGKNWITDSRGVMCEVFDVDPETMCCIESPSQISDHRDLPENHQGGSATFATFHTSPSSAKKHNCETCQSETSCCQVFENCVSCCMKDLNRARQVYADLIESSQRENDEETFKLYHSVHTQFEFCQTRCRTNSKSVVNENKYRSTFKHCF